MAGRYQGFHLFGDRDGEGHVGAEVFWQHHGWFWRPRLEGRPADDKGFGPFTTSSEAFKDAKTKLRSRIRDD